MFFSVDLCSRGHRRPPVCSTSQTLAFWFAFWHDHNVSTTSFDVILRMRMDELGIRAADVARKCDVPDSTVTRWLAGSLPRDRHIPKIAKAVDVPLDALVERVATERLAAAAARPAVQRQRHTTAERIASLEETVGALRELVEQQNETLDMLNSAIISKARQVTAPRRRTR